MTSEKIPKHGVPLMPDSVPDITPLLEKLKAGEQSALAELFDTYRPQLRRMVELRLDPRLGARVAPSDVLQEAYVDCLSRYEHFFRREGASFYVWLRLVVNQSLVDLHRRHLAAKMRRRRPGGDGLDRRHVRFAGATSGRPARIAQSDRS